jgi:hypothetical protein
LLFSQFIGCLTIKGKSEKDNQLFGNKKSASIKVLLDTTSIPLFARIGKDTLCSKFLCKIIFSSFQFLSEFVMIFSGKKVEVIHTVMIKKSLAFSRYFRKVDISILFFYIKNKWINKQY